MPAKNPHCREYVIREEDRLGVAEAELLIPSTFTDAKPWHPTAKEMSAWLIERISLDDFPEAGVIFLKLDLSHESHARRLAAAHALHPLRDVPIDSHGAFLDYCNRQGLPYNDEDTKLLRDFMKGASMAYSELRALKPEEMTEQERIMGGF